MAQIHYCDEIIPELDLLAQTAPQVEALITVLIDTLGNDPKQLEELTRETPKWHYLYNPAFEIKRFQECWDIGLRVYLLKAYHEDTGALCDYRVFIGHDIETDEYFVLSALPRSTAYDPRTQQFKDIITRYTNLHIPFFRAS